MSIFSYITKSASFSDVKAIYDSLTDEQKKFLDGPYGHIPEEKLNQDAVLTRHEIPGVGYARLWNTNAGDREVEIAVDAAKQGKGIGTELLYSLLRKAKADGIKNVTYAPHKDNVASNRLVKRITDATPKRDGDIMKYNIDLANVKDPYAADLPEDVAEAVDEVKAIYKALGYDLSDVGVKGTTRSRYESGAVTPYSVLPKELQAGASWVPTDNSVYFNPDVEAAMKLYGVKGPRKKFIRALAAHELAHAVDQRYADDAMRNKVLQEAKSEGFTTPYLDALPFEQNRDKEIFAEYLSNKILQHVSG